MSEHLPYCGPVVLVVENDILIRVFKAAALRQQGLEVFEAADIAEAVTVLKTIAVDILISDVDLIDGTVLARLAKEHQPTTEIVWMADLQIRQNSDVSAVLH
jgi:DNA-binding response OmpR family regulator